MSKEYVKDLAERVFWTAVQAAFGAGVAVATTDVNVGTVAAVPVVAAALAAVKGFLARKVGDHESAAFRG